MRLSKQPGSHFSVTCFALNWSVGIQRAPDPFGQRQPNARLVNRRGVMMDRLFVSVVGNRDSGKSTTWNTLFGGTVRTGKYARSLKLYDGECCEVFLISGSPEERGEYAGDILANTDCRIVLCSAQYTASVRKTFDFASKSGFDLCVQWLNPGFNDTGENFDRLGLMPELLARGATCSIRNGKGDPRSRTEELTQVIYGSAKTRNLTFAC